MATILNGIFKDKMVFQWGAELRVFGCCDIDCTIKAVLFKDGEQVSSNTCRTEEDGSFLVCLEPVDEPGGPYELKVYENDVEECAITDAYAGEVWLAAGGGNMEYPLKRSEFAKYIVPRIGNSEIRLYKVPTFGHLNEDQAYAEAVSEWVDITSETAGEISGVAYYFAREKRVRKNTLFFRLILLLFQGFLPVFPAAPWQPSGKDRTFLQRICR